MVPVKLPSHRRGGTPVRYLRQPVACIPQTSTAAGIRATSALLRFPPQALFRPAHRTVHPHQGFLPSYTMFLREANADKADTGHAEQRRHPHFRRPYQPDSEYAFQLKSSRSYPAHRLAQRKPAPRDTQGCPFLPVPRGCRTGSGSGHSAPANHRAHAQKQAYHTKKHLR